MDNLKNKRNHLLDIARIIAVLAVVMIHSSATFVTNYELYTNEFIFGNLFDSIARIGVPLFLMISGALFLDENKKITIKSVLSKNVKSLAFITIIWAIMYSAVYNVIFPLLTSKTISVKSFFISIVNGHYHMWYLYMMIGLYIITPFLRKFVSKENKNLVLFFIIISFVVQFLFPTIDKVCALHLDIDFIGKWIDKFHLDFFGGYITYFLVGWYIVHVGVGLKYLKYIIYCLSLISLLIIVFYVDFTGNYTIAYENIGALVFVYSLGVFLAINNIKISFKEKTIRILAKLSKLTFGVYIIHIIVLALFNTLLPYINHSAIYIILCFIIVVSVSFIGSYIISKIPILKNIIRA